MSDVQRVWIRKRRCKAGKTTYHLRWVAPGAGWRSKKVGTDRREAECEAALLQRELRQGTHTDLRKTTWQTFADEHVEQIENAGTAAVSRQVLREFGTLFAQPEPRKVTFAMVERYVAVLRDKGIATNTRNKKVKVLRAAFTKAIDRGYLGRHPMKGLRLEAEEEKPIRVVTDAEQKALEDVAERLYGFRWRVLVRMGVETGGRHDELVSAQWDAFDFTGELVTFRGKGKRHRVVPLDDAPELVAMLRRLQLQTLPAGGPFRGMNAGFYKAWRRIVGEAGCEGLRLHDLRATFVTRLVRAGAALPYVQKLAGHKDIKTTLWYYNQVSHDDLRDAVRKLRRHAGG